MRTSTYLHLAVCLLELQALTELLGENGAREHMARTDHYTWVYKTILADTDKIQSTLTRHGFGGAASSFAFGEGAWVRARRKLRARSFRTVVGTCGSGPTRRRAPQGKNRCSDPFSGSRQASSLPNHR
jgi:hypothetical protein